MRVPYTILATAAMLLATPSVAQNANPQIDYSGFLQLSAELKVVREAHLINLADFRAKAGEPRTIILDTRSAGAFQLGHIAGAINLPFSDFTDDKLASILGPDKTRPILIYCNNNFSDNVRPIPLKRPPLALNIPTFINLHGYGYTNVWELADVVSIAQVDWEAQPMVATQNR